MKSVKWISMCSDISNCKNRTNFSYFYYRAINTQTKNITAIITPKAIGIK